MIKLIDQVFELTGKLMGSLLDWPFLLFIVAVLLLSRYRNQIGSMLDRRGAVGAGELSRAVRRELEPIRKQVDAIAPAVSELRNEVERVQSLQTEKKLSALLEPVQSKIKSVDGAIAGMRAEVERLFGKELTQALGREREAVHGELTALRRSVDHNHARVEPLAAELATLRESLNKLDSAVKSAPAELEGRFAGPIEALNQNVAELKLSMDQVCTQVECAVPREVTDRLQGELDPLARGLDELRQSVALLEGLVKLAPAELEERFAGRVKPIDQEVGQLKQTIEMLQGQVKDAASKEMTERLQGELHPLAQGLDQLRQSVTVLEGTIQSVPGDVEARFSEFLQPINREVAAIKESMVQLSTRTPEVVETRPVAPEGGTRRSRKQPRSRA